MTDYSSKENFDLVKATHERQWNFAVALCRAISVLADISLVAAISMIAVSFFVESLSIPLVWINSANAQWSSTQAHFFHAFLYCLFVMVTTSFGCHFVSALMLMRKYDAAFRLRWVSWFAVLIIPLILTSFLVFVHTVTAVADYTPK